LISLTKSILSPARAISSKLSRDIHEALVQSVAGIKFGFAFCEASGALLVRWSSTDDSLIELAKRNALALSAGHSFILFLGPGFSRSTYSHHKEYSRGVPHFLRHR
jgi:adenosine/AMP kinase